MDLSCLLPDARRTAAGLLGARPIKRVRRLFLVLALVGAIAEALALLLAEDRLSAAGAITPVLALGALWVWWRQSCHEQRMPAWRDPVEFALITFVGLTAGADQTFGLLVVGLLFRSLFTGPVRTAIGVVAYQAAYLLAIGLGPDDAELSVLAGLRALPLFAIGAGVMHFFARSMLKYDALQAELAGAVADRRMAAIVRHSTDIVTLVDRDGTIRYQTPAIAQLGYTAGDLVGTDVTALVHPDDVETVMAEIDRAGRLRDGAMRPLELRWRTAGGDFRVVHTITSDLRDHPDVGAIVLTTRDVTEQRALEAELKHRAFHDSLTGLANRASLDERLVEDLAGAGTPPALVLLDLDDFKAVNDSLGHAAGDRLLVAMAQRLREAVPAPDLVARLGGDEFALLLHTPAGELPARVDAVLAAIARPFRVDRRDLRVAATAGVCVPAPGDGPEEALRNADLALYRAKDAGKGTFAIFEPHMHDAAVEALELEADLRRALAEDELELHYQPLFTAEREVAGIEALLRWRHPERGLLYPGAFLETAERSGLIVPIGRWVLREACRQGAAWNQSHPTLGRIGIGVNVSAEQLRDPDLVADVRDALADTGLPAGRLILEITETVLMQDLALAATTLEEIKTLGVSLALDDFGTGYSSLAYLQRLPLDFLKVPRPFVAALDTGEKALDLVRGIVSLGASLGLRVVAEGVETEEQRHLVHSTGCSLVQGFLLSRPVPAAEIDALLAERGRARIAVS